MLQFATPIQLKVQRSEDAQEMGQGRRCRCRRGKGPHVRLIRLPT